MTTIIAPRRISDNFGDGVDKFFLLVSHMRAVSPEEEITIDMRQCAFLTPFFLLPFFLFIRKESERRRIYIQTHEALQGCSGYLKNVFFTAAYDGLQPETYSVESYTALLETYARKSYIPIINFPASREGNNTDIRDHLLSCVNNILARQLQLRGAYRTGVMYLIDEAINNIVDHSGEQRGFIFAQYFPANAYIDICIADSGIGILGSYQKAERTEIKTARDAISNAANGVSTKNRPEAEGRGFGISTSLDMLVNGLKGKYLLLSGNAFLLKNALKEELTSIADVLNYGGTIVALRIPYTGNNDFNPAKYFGG